MGGTERSAVTQANALAANAQHDVTILSVLRSADEPHYAIDERVTVQHLVDVRPRDRTRPAPRRGVGAGAHAAGTASSRRSPTSPSRGALRQVHADVVVTVTPALLAVGGPAAPRRRRGRPPGAPVVLAAHQRHGAAARLRPARRRRRPADPVDRDLAARRARAGRARDGGRAQRAPPGSRPPLAARRQGHRHGRTAGHGEAVHQAGGGLRRRRRPAARLAAADPRRRPPAPAPGPGDPQARPLRPGRAPGIGHRHARRVGQGQHLRPELARRGVPARAPGGDGGRGAVRQLRLRVRAARDRRARGQRPARHPRVGRPGCPPRCSGSPPTTTCGAGSARARWPPPRSTTPTRSPRAGSAIFEDAVARRAGRPRFAALSTVPPRRRHRCARLRAGPPDPGPRPAPRPRCRWSSCARGHRRRVAGDPAARARVGGRRGAHRRPPPVPRGARRGRPAAVPLPARPRQRRLARAPRRGVRAGPRAPARPHARRRARALAPRPGRAAARGRPGLLGRGRVLGDQRRGPAGGAAAQPLHPAHPARHRDRRAPRSRASRSAPCR